ncbi:unnamed protein product, partial [Brassica rapa]
LIKIKSSKLRRLHQNYAHTYKIFLLSYIHLVLQFHSSSMKPR